MRYLLCMPEGGFNDIISQIRIALHYASRTGRTLVIDTTRSGTFRDAFSVYFTPKIPGVIARLTPRLVAHLNTLSVFPPVLTGRLDGFEEKILDGCGIFERPGGVLLSFDFNNTAYREDVLVHRNSGGGPGGAACLKNFTLTGRLAEEIVAALRPLDTAYYAVHVRNTDYRTDYRSFFRSIYEEVCGKRLLVCSDDRQCREEAARFFSRSAVMTVSDIPDTRGRALHTFRDIAPYENNRAMLIDLFALAGAEKLFFSRVESDAVAFSGFSKLAQELHAERHGLGDFFVALGTDVLPRGMVGVAAP